MNQDRLDQELWEAAKKGEVQTAGTLLDSKANIHDQDDLNLTPLHTASLNGKLEVVKLLVARKANPNMPDRDGDSALHSASASGEQSVVEFLLNSNANITLQDNDGDTPLHRASYLGYAAVVEVLLARNADTSIKNKKGQTARDRAVAGKEPDVVKLLDKANPPPPSLFTRLFWKTEEKNPPSSYISPTQGNLATRSSTTTTITTTSSSSSSSSSSPSSSSSSPTAKPATAAAATKTAVDKGKMTEEVLRKGNAFGRQLSAHEEKPAAKVIDIPPQNPPPQSLQLSSSSSSLSSSSASSSSDKQAPLEEEGEVFDDPDEFADFSKLFPFHCQDNIPFHDSHFKQFSASNSAKAKDFRQLCETQRWKTINQLLSNIEKTQASCLEDRELKTWLDGLRVRTYPAYVDSSDITLLGDPLAKGNFGEVYSAQWKLKSGGGKLIVAYKKLLKDESDELMDEYNMWTALPHHDNVARLYGAVWDGPTADKKRIVALVAELHPKGSLLGNSKLEVGELAKLQVVLGVAKGLQHLHNHMIVHRDVFARNILLTKDTKTDALIPILTDFGLSRVAPYKWSRNRPIPRGTAPEVERGNNPFTFESDIYSLAVLAWEMSNPGKPIPDELSFKGATETNKIALRCSHLNPKSRPSLDQVIKMCTDAIAHLERPLDDEKDVVVDKELLAMLKELEISEPEARARGFSKDKCTLKILRTLPYPLFLEECLGHGMVKGEVFAFASKLGKF